MQELDFSQFQKQYLDPLEPGDVAFHGQLHPGPYPPNLAQHEQIKASGRPPVHDERPAFFDLLEKYKNQGVLINHLRVLPIPGWNGYTKDDALALVRCFDTEQNQLENIRFAWFGQQVARLMHYCGENEVVDSYLEGVKADNPQAGFWSIRKRNEPTIRTLGTMSYINRESTPLRVRSWPPVAHTRFEHFWKDVFDDPEQSFDMSTAQAILSEL